MKQHSDSSSHYLAGPSPAPPLSYLPSSLLLSASSPPSTSTGSGFQLVLELRRESLAKGVLDFAFYLRNSSSLEEDSTRRSQEINDEDEI